MISLISWRSVGVLAVALMESRAETWTCEARRKALEQCLKRLEKAGVIAL